MKTGRKCKCGCGQVATAGGYKYGHRIANKRRKRCACGCGLLTEPGNSYIHGHHRRGLHHTPSSKDAISKAQKILQKNGGNRLGQTNSTTHRRRISEGSINGTKEIREKISTTMLGKNKGKIAWNKGLKGAQKMTSASKKKMSNTHKQRWAALTQKEQTSIIRKRFTVALPTKLEKKVLQYLKKFGFKYVGDLRKWITYNDHKYNPDFVNEKEKTIVELFGRHWHNKPAIQERDKRRLVAYRKNGYKTIVIWDDLFKLQPEKQIARVKAVIGV